MPILSSTFFTSKPGVPFSAMKALMRRDGLRVGHGEDRVDVRDAVGGPLLLAADDVVVPVLVGTDRQSLRVGASELAEAERHELVASGDLRASASSAPRCPRG